MISNLEKWLRGDWVEKQSPELVSLVNCDALKMFALKGLD